MFSSMCPLALSYQGEFQAFGGGGGGSDTHLGMETTFH